MRIKGESTLENNQYISSIRFKKKIEDRSYLSKIPAIKYLNEGNTIDFTNNITIFVGENGSGKSTLLEAIAVAYGFNPEGGSKNYNFSTKQTHSPLWENLTLSRINYPKDGYFLRAESFYNASTYHEEVYEAEIRDPNNPIESFHERSHGESFLSLVETRFWGNGLYILDEPEAALSPMKLMRLMVHIDRLCKNNSQFIIATHSPILMTFPNAEILELSEDGINSISYRETEHYQITRRFLENPDKMLSYLLDEEI